MDASRHGVIALIAILRLRLAVLISGRLAA